MRNITRTLLLDILALMVGLVPWCMAEQPADQPAHNVTVQVMMFHGSVDVVDELFHDPLGPGRSFEVSEATLKRIREFEGKKKISGMFRSQVATLSGYQAQLRVVTEMIYATEYDLQKTSFEDLPDKSAGRTICVPESFRTREVGSLLNVTPLIAPDGKTVSVTVIPESSILLGYKGHRVKRAQPVGTAGVNVPDNDDNEETTDESEALMPVEVNMPEFASANLTTSVVVASGRPVILAVSTPSSQQKNIPSDHLIVMILTATVARVGGGK